MHNRGIGLGVIVAALVIATLSGCSPLSPTVVTPGLGTAGGAAVAQEALAAVGSGEVAKCWQVTYDGFLQQPQNVGSTDVPCTSPHQAYTFAVDELNAGLQRIDATPVAYNACAASYLTTFTLSANEARLYLSEVLPSSAAWVTGDRSVGCTIQLSAVGSHFRGPTFADLPEFSTFLKSVNSSPTDYSVCVNDPGTNGTTGPTLGTDAIIADCSTGQWLLEPSPRFPDPAGEAYPGYDALYPFMHSHCGALYDTATIRGWVFYPSEQQWADGSRDFQCWTGKR